MLSQLINQIANILAAIGIIGLVLAVMSRCFRSWRPLFRLYLKGLKFSVAGIAKLLWRPAFPRRGVGHLVEERHRQEAP